MPDEEHVPFAVSVDELPMTGGQRSRPRIVVEVEGYGKLALEVAQAKRLCDEIRTLIDGLPSEP